MEMATTKQSIRDVLKMITKVALSGVDVVKAIYHTLLCILISNKSMMEKHPRELTTQKTLLEEVEVGLESKEKNK